MIIVEKHLPSELAQARILLSVINEKIERMERWGGVYNPHAEEMVYKDSVFVWFAIKYIITMQTDLVNDYETGISNVLSGLHTLNAKYL